MKKELAGHIWALDVLKAFAVLGVVIQHCVFSGWAAGPVRTNLVVQAVPVFLTITGITFSISCVRRKTEEIGAYYRRQLWHNLWRMIWPYSLAYLFETYYHSVLWTRVDWMQWGDDPAYGYYRFREMAALYPRGGLGPGAYYIDLLGVVILAFPVLYWLANRCWWVGLALMLLVLREGGRLHGFWSRVPYALISVYIGVLIFYFWNRTGREGKARPLWEYGIAAALLVALGIPEGAKAGLIVLAGLLLLPWKPNGLPCRVFSWLGKASFDIFVVQKIFFSTRYPAYLVMEYGFTEWNLAWTAMAAGLAYYFVETWLYKALLYLAKRCRNAWHKQKEPLAL